MSLDRGTNSYQSYRIQLSSTAAKFFRSMFYHSKVTVYPFKNVSLSQCAKRPIMKPLKSVIFKIGLGYIVMVLFKNSNGTNSQGFIHTYPFQVNIDETINIHCSKY